MLERATGSLPQPHASPERNLALAAEGNENNELPYHMVPVLGGSPTALRMALAGSINHMWQRARQLQAVANKQPEAVRGTQMHAWLACYEPSELHPSAR